MAEREGRAAFWNPVQGVDRIPEVHYPGIAIPESWRIPVLVQQREGDSKTRVQNSNADNEGKIQLFLIFVQYLFIPKKGIK